MVTHFPVRPPRDSINVFVNWSAAAASRATKWRHSPRISPIRGWWRCWPRNLELHWNDFLWLPIRAGGFASGCDATAAPDICGVAWAGVAIWRRLALADFGG